MIFLDFDRGTLNSGSREHYFHYLWGYLLPAFQFLTNRGGGAPNRARLLTCGPTMDRVTEEACALIGVRATIVQGDLGDVPRAMVPRWDRVLQRRASFSRPPDPMQRPPQLNGFSVPVLHRVRNLKARLSDPEYRQLQRELPKLRRKLISAAQEIVAPDPDLDGRILVLRRSEMPEYYATDGAAEIKGYGAARRTLDGIEGAVEELRRMGLPVAAFEPGAAGFAKQVKAFSNAAGIVGVRGAEFANLIWMAPGRRALMLSPLEMGANFTVHHEIAKLSGVDLIGEKVNQRGVVTLDPEAVMRYFRSNKSLT